MNDTKWLTVDEAAHLSQEMGLNRTKKTIRSWARNRHVASHKQTTATGEMWVLDKSELVAKIKAEKEFADQQGEVRTSTDKGDPVRTRSNQYEPVQTGANPSEPVRDSSRGSEQGGSGDVTREGAGTASARDEIRSLQTQIQTLSIDVKWRDQMLDKLTRENEAMLENLHGQARYIGHLESDLMRLGGQPDAQFLAAPKVPEKDGTGSGGEQRMMRPEYVSPDRPHPDQQSFVSG